MKATKIKPRGRKPSIADGERFNFVLPEEVKVKMKDLIEESKAVANLPLSYSFIIRTGIDLFVREHRAMLNATKKGKFHAKSR